MHLSDAEVRVMNVVWDAGGQALERDIYKEFADRYDYQPGNTNVLIKRCLAKGALAREGKVRSYLCRALISREEYQAGAIRSLRDKLFGGSLDGLIAALARCDDVTGEQLDELEAMIEKKRRELAEQIDRLDSISMRGGGRDASGRTS